ncbi:MAG: DUF1015 domain-containing protein [Candidatus Aminicenantes bacterium]|nr:DUF1015 domain-containing protein [Candidatus Aminicenantes bacterium]
MQAIESIGLGIPSVLLPRDGTDLNKWAVIACDQFTSEQEYWHTVQSIAGDAPSSLNLIYPEVYLGEKDSEARIQRIRTFMKRYLDEGLFVERPGFVYVERRVARQTRRGLLMCVDLERYDYSRGSRSLIRATEGTILERIPPRVRIREGAPLELPHIMILIDDPHDSVIGPLASGRAAHEKLYDFELMMGSGRLAGYRVVDPKLEEGVVCGLEKLAEPALFAEKYGLSPGAPVLLFAMGDGNHSLATAKAIWEKAKETASDPAAILASPLRYALVELVNLYDPALHFEPIHRVLFDVADNPGLVKSLERRFGDSLRLYKASGLESMRKEVESQKGLAQKVGLISPGGYAVAEFSRPDFVLPVGTLQDFLDQYLAARGARAIDYVHGTEAVDSLGRKPGNAGVFLPAMNKTDLFKTVILDGALPRKTFSMGEAREKRFYMEARRLF